MLGKNLNHFASSSTSERPQRPVGLTLWGISLIVVNILILSAVWFGFQFGIIGLFGGWLTIPLTVSAIALWSLICILGILTGIFCLKLNPKFFTYYSSWFTPFFFFVALPVAFIYATKLFSGSIIYEIGFLVVFLLIIGLLFNANGVKKYQNFFPALSDDRAKFSLTLKTLLMIAGITIFGALVLDFLALYLWLSFL